MQRLLTTFLTLATLLAGCSDAPPAANDDVVLGPDGEPVVAALHNYTTLHTGGEPFTRTYTGTLTNDEAVNSNSAPLGVAVPNFESCCSMDWIDVTDLLVTDQLVALRLTLTWTNTPSDHAGLDVATCIPWGCTAFNYGPDESQEEGSHTDVLTLISSGRQDFVDLGIPYQVGVRFTNAVVPNGLPYTIAVEAFPVAGGLAPVDPYVIHVAEGANVTAELVGPFAESVRTALMVYGEDDRPSQWIELAGAHGSRHAVPLAAGTHVLLPFDVDGGFVRLATDTLPSSLRIERLREEFGSVEVARVPDVQEHAGTFSYQAEPGTIDPFPFFLYGEGAAAQDLFGLTPDDLGGAMATLSSSSGVIATVGQRQLSTQVGAVGQNCLQCGTSVDYDPSKYIDDDGSYDVAWSSKGAAGTFVLFTAKYVR